MRLNRQLLAVAALTPFAVAALAQPMSGGEAAKTRAQVRAETAAAVAAGQIPRGEGTPTAPQAFHSTGSRAAVRAQTLAAMAAGQIPRGEATPISSDVFVSTKTRAEVRAETRMAMRLGLIPHGEAPLRDATPSQAELIRLAGERARAADPRLASR